MNPYDSRFSVHSSKYLIYSVLALLFAAGFLLIFSRLAPLSPQAQHSPTAQNPPTFAIYLLADEMAVEQAVKADVNRLRLAHQPVLTLSEVLGYTQESGEMRLVPAAAARLGRLSVPVSGVPFVIVINGRPAYTGAFWTGVSSLSYDLSIVADVLLVPTTGRLRFDLGYPTSPQFFQGHDWRAAPDLLSVFEQTGKLED
jgi:hypothetical protein